MPKSLPKLSFQKPTTQQAEPRPDRVGKRLLQCHLPEELSTEMRVLAARRKTTVTALIEEAITDLFAKYQHTL
jgi:antitoxin-like ribbon-helix-helix protein